MSDYQVVIHHVLASSKNCDTPCGHLVFNQVYLNQYCLIWLFFDSKLFIFFLDFLKVENYLNTCSIHNAK
jgi:hypothetical protein